MTDELELLPVSYSKLSGYRDCPYRCKYEPFTQSIPALFGDIFHHAMADVHRGKKSEAKAGMNAAIAKNGIERAKATELITMFDEYSENPRYDVEKERIVTVESDDGETRLYGKPYFLVPLPIIANCADGKRKRIALRGAFDLVIRRKDADDGIEIRDYKTGMSEADDFQADLYALAAFLKYWRVSPIYTSFVYTKKGFMTRPVKYTESELVSVLEYVSILATAYAQETEWKPKFNHHCAYCTLKLKCSEYQEKISTVPEKQEVDPENWQAIQTWKEQIKAISKVAESFLDDLSEKEKNYLKNHGPQVVGNGTKEAVLCEETARYDIPTSAVSSLLMNHKIDPLEALQFSSGKLDLLLKNSMIRGVISDQKMKELLEEIDTLKTVASTKFIVRAKPIKK